MRTPTALPVLLAVLSGAAPIGFTAHFKCGMLGTKSDEVTLLVPRPPDAFLQQKNVLITVDEAVGAFRGHAGLKSGIEKALTPDFAVVAAKPEATIKVAVTAYERPTTRTFTVVETRNMKVGQKQAKNSDGTGKVNKKGEPIMVDVYEDRPVPVQYWEGRGSLAASVKVEDANGVLLDGFTPRADYSEKRELSVQGVASTGGGLARPSKATMNPFRLARSAAATPSGARSSSALPTPDAIDIELVEDLAGGFTPRYRKTRVAEQFKLSCTDPLRPGNDAAKGGDWAGALKLWDSAKMKKKDEEGDRIFNIAAANEALAYDTYAKQQNPDEAEPQFAKALELYEQARQLDPKEKYITQSSGRLQRARANIENAKKQYAAQQLAALEALKQAEDKQKELDAEKLKAEAERMKKEAEEKALWDPRPDSQSEAVFRNVARAKFKTLPVPVAAEEAGKLQTMGGMAFKLQPNEAKRVVLQEKKWREEIDSKLAMYKESFSALVSDKTVSAEERTMLAQVSQNLGLGEDDTKGVESQFQFTEPGKTPPPAPKAAAAKAPPKPVVPQPKPPVAQQPKPAVAQPKPAPAAGSAPQAPKPPAPAVQTPAVPPKK